MRKGSRLVLLAGSLCVALGCARAQPREVVVGLLYPLSGPAAPAAIDEKRALELFADMVNGEAPMLPGPFYQKLRGLSGLPGGARLRLVFVDDQGRPDVGAAEAERLITRAGAHALVGALQSSVTATASRAAERLGVPFLAPESVAPGLTRRGFRWFFRTSPHDEHLTQAMFDFLADFQKRRGVKLETVAISGEDTPVGADAARVERALAQKYGYRIVADFTGPASRASVAAEVQKLKAANPDVWLPAFCPPDAALFTRTAREQDWHPRMILARDGGRLDPGLTEGAGKDADGHLARTSFSPDLIDRNPVARALNDPYRARSGKDLDDLSARAVTGLVTLVDAINRAGSIGPEAIRGALARTDIKPADLLVPWTGVKFDETGQNVGVRAVIVQRQGGRNRTVWPFDLATADVAFPIPTWSERR